MRDTSDICVVLTTAPDQATAETLARTLVDEHLIACATLLPGATSIYRWKGAVTHEPEIQLLLKTRRELLTALSTRLHALHPYEVPEVLVLDATAGSAPYLDWILSSTTHDHHTGPST
jgi:periplasmic divalent cation tolerance protein